MDKPSQILKLIWNNIQDGVKSRHSGFHLMGFHYINDDRPRSTTVVIRNCDSYARSISFHTDYRQNKSRYIEKNPYVCLLFYSKQEKIQIVCNGRAKLHKNDIVTETAWKNMQPISKTCYCQDLIPGQPHNEFSNGFSQERWREKSSPQILESGYENFSVITTTIDQIEWLYLSVEGNKRIQFNYENNDKKWTSNWLIP
ncbi:MAG: pyridoxamine 5'-phosphate oxidase family protein [Pseudomonadota bacterium]|nr:pyridoxamine 5'-phosphate oxidase family protein [Pseudomonadota bacterium]